MIPYINTIDDLKEIAKSYLIEFKPISQTCLIMYILNKYNIGNIAVVSNEIICTFHYNCGDIRYVRKFISILDMNPTFLIYPLKN